MACKQSVMCSGPPMWNVAFLLGLESAAHHDLSSLPYHEPGAVSIYHRSQNDCSFQKGVNPRNHFHVWTLTKILRADSLGLRSIWQEIEVEHHSLG